VTVETPPPPPPIFDAQLYPAALADDDLRDLAFFGVQGAVAVVGDDVPGREPEAILGRFEALVREDLPRLRRAGLAAFGALGLDPRRLPERGLEEILARLPALFSTARLVALGPIGLEAGGAEEEAAFLRQLEVAHDLGRPVIVRTPEREKLRITRRLLALLKESGLPPERVLVDAVTPKTIRLVRACGHAAGIVVHPARLRAEEAVELVRRMGSGALVLGSAAGAGASDLLALPRTAMLLDRAGLSPQIVRRVLRDNALAFFGIDPGVVAREAPPVGAPPRR
jgi:predicted metal-dependent TIM-barrel fold hydrolase